MPWVAIWTDILHDPKLQLSDGEELELLPWLVALAGKVDNGGRLASGAVALSAEYMAGAMPRGVTPSRVLTCIASCVVLGILELRDGAPVFASWMERQRMWETSKGQRLAPSARPGASTPRVQKHRARLRARSELAPAAQ
jgi:hypothetical protein